MRRPTLPPPWRPSEGVFDKNVHGDDVFNPLTFLQLSEVSMCMNEATVLQDANGHATSAELSAFGTCF
eukprot:365911-Chlamydomonas_euryale.AAC.10